MKRLRRTACAGTFSVPTDKFRPNASVLAARSRPAATNRADCLLGLWMVAKAEAGVWVHRCLSERATAAQYVRLATSLKKVRPSSAFIDALLEGAEDEHRHAQLCLQQARELGFSGALETPGAFAVASAASQPSFERITGEVAVTLAIGESLNAVLLQHELDRCPRALLKDEVQHARLGWRFLTEAASTMELSFLSAPLTLALREAEARLMQHTAPTTSPLDSPTRLMLWRETLQTVILPGLNSIELVSSLAEVKIRRLVRVAFDRLS